MIDLITITTNHLLPGNALASMFRLRYRSVIKRQDWDVPTYQDMEYDNYDNIATKYFVWRDKDNEVRGTARLNPTTRPYMLQQAFPHLATYESYPNDNTIWEGSRICVDKDLSPDERRNVIAELGLAYCEYGVSEGITRIIGLMHPVFWKTVYINNGWETFWYGDVTPLTNGERVRAGGLMVSESALERLREVSGIHTSVLNIDNLTLPELKVA
jgi:N-acyl-L-homoserine lactone synthetase